MAGRPMYEWSVRALRAAESIGRIVIAAPPGDEASFAGEGVAVVAGGAARSDSVLAALDATDADLVAVHDAARPLLGAGLVDALVAALDAAPGAAGIVPAAPVTDTIKRARAARPAAGKVPDEALTIAETEDRDLLWAAQTPQVFRVDALRNALAEGDRGAATDEASLVEQAGHKVLLFQNDAPNPKVTTPADLALVAALLRGEDLGTPPTG